MRIKLTVSYDGTDFNGWQPQTTGNTVQQSLENAVFELTGVAVTVTGSGRTDAGVHAKGQVAHFDIENCTIPPKNFARALNTKLPPSVRVIESVLADENFNSRKSAKRKTYSYNFYISNTELPLKERYATRLEKAPNFSLMEKACSAFVGEHDFKAFCASGSSVKTTVRTIYSVDLKVADGEFSVKICGNGFLYNMVRIICGVILDVGYGKKRVEDIEKAFADGRREKLGKTLPAKALVLESVEYE